MSGNHAPLSAELADYAPTDLRPPVASISEAVQNGFRTPKIIGSREPNGTESSRGFMASSEVSSALKL